MLMSLLGFAALIIMFKMYMKGWEKENDLEIYKMNQKARMDIGLPPEF